MKLRKRNITELLFTKEPSTRFSPTLLAPCCKTNMPLWQKASWTKMKELAETSGNTQKSG